MPESSNGETRTRVVLLAACVTGIVTFALTLVVLRRGLAFGPDAWNYWSASVSLLEGRGYVDAHGLTVLSGPPLYSAWLALVQALCGISVASVRLADATSNAVFAGSLCAWLLLRMRGRARNWPVVVFSASAALGAVRGAGSEYPMHALLFVLLVVLERWRRARGPAGRAVAVAAAAVLAGLLVAVRHAALAFVPACVVWITCDRSRSVAHRVVTIVVILAAVVASCAGIHFVLESSRAFPLFRGDRDACTTAGTMLEAIGRDIGPFPLGILVWFVVGAVVTVVPLRRWVARTLLLEEVVLRQADAVVFVGVALLGVFVMFQVVPVADPPGGRFVRFASVIVGGLGVAIAGSSPKSRWRAALLAVLLLPAVVHAGKHVVVGRSGRNTVNTEGGESWLPPNATLRAGVAAGTVLPDGLVVVDVPLFSWQATRIDRGERR